MSFQALLLNLYLLSSLYAIFFLWKDDIISVGGTIDEIVNYYSKTTSRPEVIRRMVGCCICPILNLVTLFRLVVAEIDTIVFRPKQPCRLIVPPDKRIAVHQHRNVLLAQLNNIHKDKKLDELMQQIKTCNQVLAVLEKDAESKQESFSYPKHLRCLDENLGNVNLSIHSLNETYYSFFINVTFQPVFDSGYMYLSKKKAQSEGRKKMKEFTFENYNDNNP